MSPMLHIIGTRGSNRARKELLNGPTVFEKLKFKGYLILRDTPKDNLHRGLEFKWGAGTPKDNVWIISKSDSNTQLM